MIDGTVAALLDRLGADLDSLLELDLTRLGRADLLSLLRGVEQQTQRLPPVHARQVSELDRRGVAGQLGSPGREGTVGGPGPG